LDLQDLSARKDRKETQVQPARQAQLERLEHLELQAPPAILALRGQPVQLDSKAPLVRKGQKETPEQPVRQALLERLEHLEPPAILALRGQPDLLAEGLTAGWSFKAAALSSCTESPD
jgi:hypothetical protein